MSTKRIKILIADDHQIVIDGLRSILKNNDQIDIMGEALDGKEALDILEKREVDIAVLDINMPHMNGIETTKIIKEKYPSVKILFLTMILTQEFVHQAIQIGADGYILKNRGKEELEAALIALANGDEYFGSEANKALRSGFKKKVQENGKVKLTKREIQVLELIGKGYTSPQIAEQLFIAKSTVETHRRSLIEKTQVRNSKELVRYAIKNDYA